MSTELDAPVYSDGEADPDRSFDHDVSGDEADSGYTEEECYEAIWQIIQEQKPFLTKRFFRSKESLKEHAPALSTMYQNLTKRKAPTEVALQFLILSLYDVVILADDSFSMRIKEGGKRKETLQTIISLIADVYSMARPQGIVSLKFFNNPPGYKNITPGKVAKAIREHHFSGVTRIGSELQLKILNQYGQFKQMQRPLLVMIITDGAIEGEDPNLLRDVIVDSVRKLQKEGEDPEASQAISFHFSRIGKDKDAKKMLEELDKDRRIGQYIDCLPVHFALEMLEGKKPGEELTPKQWMTLGKLMLGGILRSWDISNHHDLFLKAEDGGYEQIQENKPGDDGSDIELEEED